MKLSVTFTGMAPVREAAIIKRATALLMEMEREFGHLKVEVSNAKAQPSGAKAGKDGGVARIAGEATAGGSERGKAAHR